MTVNFKLYRNIEYRLGRCTDISYDEIQLPTYTLGFRYEFRLSIVYYGAILYTGGIDKVTDNKLLTRVCTYTLDAATRSVPS